MRTVLLAPARSAGSPDGGRPTRHRDAAQGPPATARLPGTAPGTCGPQRDAHGTVMFATMSSPQTSRQVPDRNLAMELVRVTEAAAMAATRWMGRGDKNGADGAAV